MLRPTSDSQQQWQATYKLGYIWIVFCCSNSRTSGIEHFSNLESPQGTILARISKVLNLNLLESNPIVQSLNAVVSLCVQIFWADSSVDLLSTVTVAVLCYAHWGTTHRKSMRSRVSASSISIPSRRNWLIEPRFAMKSYKVVTCCQCSLDSECYWPANEFRGIQESFECSDWPVPRDSVAKDKTVNTYGHKPSEFVQRS